MLPECSISPPSAVRTIDGSISRNDRKRFTFSLSWPMTLTAICIKKISKAMAHHAGRIRRSQNRSSANGNGGRDVSLMRMLLLKRRRHRLRGGARLLAIVLNEGFLQRGLRRGEAGYRESGGA